MNRFAALDIDDFEDEGNAPDQSERDEQLRKEIKKARAAGLGPELDDLEKLRALQWITGATYDDNPEVKKALDEFFEKNSFSSAVKETPVGKVLDRDAVLKMTVSLQDLATARLSELDSAIEKFRPKKQYPVQWLQQLINDKYNRARLKVDGILGASTLRLAVMKKIWTTKEGETIAIKDMSDTHLLNAARMLMRGERADRDVMLRVLEYEANRRGRLL